MTMLHTIISTSLIEIDYELINKKYKAHIIVHQPFNKINIYLTNNLMIYIVFSCIFQFVDNPTFKYI